MLRSYIECVLELPWNTATKDVIDLKKTKKILDEDHYGLEKVKDRILEYLAVMSLSKDFKGPIICLADVYKRQVCDWYGEYSGCDSLP